MEPIETFDHKGLVIEIHYDDDGNDYANPRKCDGNLGTMFCDYSGYTLGDEDAPDPREQTVTCEKCEGSGESELYQVVNRRAYGHEVVHDDFPSLAAAEAYMELHAPEDALWHCEPEECNACEGSGRRDVSPLEYIVHEHGAKVILPLFVYEHSGITMRCGGNLLTGEDNMVSRNRFVGDAAGWDTSTVGFIYDTADARKEWGCEHFAVETIVENLESEVEAYAAYLEGRVYGFVVKDSEGEMLDSCWGFLETEWDWEKTGVLDQARDMADYHVAAAAKEAAEAERWACADVMTV